MGKKPTFPQAPKDEPLLEGLSPELQESLTKIKRYERSVLKKLKEPQLAELFLKDPGAALARMGIPMDPLLRKRAKVEGISDLLASRNFCFPNGQKIAPRIKISFVSHKGEKGHARR